MVSMNRLSTEQRARVVASLVEGASIRSTVRTSGAAKATVTKLLVDLGTACSVHMDHAMRDLPCTNIQCDEIWAFVYSKQKNVPEHKRGEAGDVWTWVAIDSDTKLVPTYHVGPRDLGSAVAFIADLAKRLRNRPQITTDGFPPYSTAIERAFGDDVDYAQLVKLYGTDGSAPGRYSPPRLIATDPRRVTGNPDPERISTSYVERQNLTMRMSMRRFTRLSNGFSKKAENLTAAVSLHFCHYNFCRPHKALARPYGPRVTPAMAAGVTDHAWTLDELIGLLEAAERVPVRRGAYRKTRERRAATANST
jgi:IS1 family transposase